MLASYAPMVRVWKPKPIGKGTLTAPWNLRTPSSRQTARTATEQMAILKFVSETLLPRRRRLLSGGRLSGRGLCRHIFGDDRGIDLGHRGIRQPSPGLVLAEQRDAEIAAQDQRLPIGAQRHLGVVDRAVARIENVAVLIFQSIPLHVAD